jgi:MoaA/NifB/PqqE/SkfB family radical SAM enzyme
VSISGGEPFLVPELPFLLQVFLENGIDVVVATNGLLMNPESIRHLAALSNRLHFQVSLDGSCADTHNQIRGAETFERTVAVIQRAVAFFPITMAFTVTSRSFREIPAVIDLASKLQCSAVKLQRFIPTATVPDQTLALSIAQRDEAISLVRGSLSAGRLGSLELFDCISPRTGCGRERSDLVCGPGLSECTITPDGSVVKCGAILDSTPRFGNVVEESFADIWTRLSMSSLGEGSGGCLCQA